MAKRTKSFAQMQKDAVKDYGLTYAPSPVEISLANTKKRVTGAKQTWEQVGVKSIPAPTPKIQTMPTTKPTGVPGGQSAFGMKVIDNNGLPMGVPNYAAASGLKKQTQTYTAPKAAAVSALPAAVQVQRTMEKPKGVLETLQDATYRMFNPTQGMTQEQGKNNVLAMAHDNFMNANDAGWENIRVGVESQLANINTNVKKRMAQIALQKGDLGTHARLVKEIAQQEKSVLDNMKVASANKQYMQNEAQQRYAASNPALKKTVEMAAGGVGSMVPMLTAQVMGAPGIMAAALQGAGAGFEQANEDGATMQQAYNNGLLTGAVSAGVEKLVGGIPLMGEGVLPVKKFVAEYVKSPAGRAVVTRLMEATGEGMEEVIENLVTPVVNKLTYGKNADWGEVAQSLPDAFMGGALASALVSAPGDIAQGINRKRTQAAQDAQQVMKAAQQNADTVMQTEDAVQSVVPNMESVDALQMGTNKAVRVGKNTTIQNPYTGEKPQAIKNAIYNSVQVRAEDVALAQNQIKTAQNNPNAGIKKSLSTFYRQALGNLFNGREVVAQNARFRNEPYKVTLNKNVIDKIISDKNMSAEKYAAMHNIDNIVTNAHYVGSGEYIPHGAKRKEVTRYDYFETPATINGQEYTVSFDVEVIPGTNKYRMHKVIKNIELIPISNVEARSRTGRIAYGDVDARPGTGGIADGAAKSNTTDTALFNSILPHADKNASPLQKPVQDFGYEFLTDPKIKENAIKEKQEFEVRILEPLIAGAPRVKNIDDLQMQTKENKDINELLSKRLQLPQAVAADTLASNPIISNPQENATQNQKANLQLTAQQDKTLQTMQSFAQKRGMDFKTMPGENGSLQVSFGNSDDMRTVRVAPDGKIYAKKDAVDAIKAETQNNLKSDNAEKPQFTFAPEETALPATSGKAQRVQHRKESALVKRIADDLGVPNVAQREYLRPMVKQIEAEVREHGTVRQETADALFNKAYDKGIVIQNEFYEQYKDLKDELRKYPLVINKADAQSREYRDMRNRYFGSLKLLENSDGIKVDEKYADLCDRFPELFDPDIDAPLDQLESIGEVAKSIRPSETSLAQSLGADAEDFKRYARNSFDKAVEAFVQDTQKTVRFENDLTQQAEQKESRTMPELPDVQQVKEAYKANQRLRRKADKAMAATLLTDADKKAVEKLLRGDIDPEDVKSENKADILYVYNARKAANDVLAPIKEYNAARREGLLADAERAVENSDAWKDKKSGLQYSAETMERNMRDIVTDKAEAKQITQKYFEPVHRHEADATRFKNEMRAKVAELKLNRQESEYLQIYGELKGVEAAKKMGLHRSDAEFESLQKTAADYLEENTQKIDQMKIEEALQVFRNVYDDVFEKMNDAYIKNGYAPVEYRYGYFPHFEDNKPDGIVSRIASKMGFNIQKDTLPTDIAGLTYMFKPGRRYNANAKQRTGFETAYDAVQGFDRYIETAADVIYHTEDIQNLRALEDAIRFKNSEKGLKEEMQNIRNDEALTEEQKENRLNEIREKSKSHLNHFVQELQEYTNLLAGKKSLNDRLMEKDTGRAAYQVMSQIENRVAANMVAVNPGSWLTNFIPMTQASAECSTASMVKAAKETAQAYFKDDGFADSSTFLTNRRGSTPLSKTTLQQISEKLTSPMAYIDDFTSSVVTRAKYYDNVKTGMDTDTAMKDADAYAASIIADRSKGALPTVFERKNPLTRLLTMYQVEVNNQLRYLVKDLPDNMKGKGLALIVGALMKYTIGAYLYNDLYEKLVGRRPALDFIGMANQAIGDAAGYKLPNTVDLIGDTLSGKGADFTAKKKGAVGTVTALGKNVAEELPFVGGLLGGGRIPISSALPDIGTIATNAVGIASGEKNKAKAAQGIAKEIAKPVYYLGLPFGGGQVKKAVEGIGTVAKGGSYGLDSRGEDVLQFPVENPNLGTYAKAAVFGKYALPGAQDYVDSGFKAKSANYTKAYKTALAQGLDGESFRKVWDNMDADGNGTVNTAERYAAIQALPANDAQREALWKLGASESRTKKYNNALSRGLAIEFVKTELMLAGNTSQENIYRTLKAVGYDEGVKSRLWDVFTESKTSWEEYQRKQKIKNMKG